MEKVAAYQTAHPNGPPSVSAKQTLQEFTIIWLRDVVEPTTALNTWESYGSTYATYIAPYLGNTPLCDLTAPQVQAWLNDLAAKNLGRTVEYARSILRIILNQAIKWDILDKNVATKVTLPARKTPPRKGTALTLPQAQSLIAAAGGYRDVRKSMVRKDGKPMPPLPITTRLEMLYILAVACGLRRGELVALRWHCVNWEAETLLVEASIDRKRRSGDTKSGQSRVVSIVGLTPLLREHQRRMQAEDHTEGWKPDGLMFPTTLGTVMDPGNVNRHFEGVLEAAGLPPMRFHDLRHTAGSLMLAEGGKLVDVSKLLGHSSPVITGNIYAHSLEEGRRNAVGGVTRKLTKKAGGEE
jgi:integrase